MIVELELPARVNLRDAVPMTLRARNDGVEPAQLALTGRPIAFDVVVEQPDGKEVWRRLRGEVISMTLQFTILQPGEVLEFPLEWSQRDNAGRGVAPGTYLVHGVLAASDRQLRSEQRRLVIAG